MASKKIIEQEIAYHLKNNDPESAKSVYDQWIMKQTQTNLDNEMTLNSTEQSDHDILF